MFWFLNITKTGLVANAQLKEKRWCSRILPVNMKTGICVPNDCESGCQQQWKGDFTMGRCGDYNHEGKDPKKCYCTLLCPNPGHLRWV